MPLAEDRMAAILLLHTSLRADNHKQKLWHAFAIAVGIIGQLADDVDCTRTHLPRGRDSSPGGEDHTYLTFTQLPPGRTPHSLEADALINSIGNIVPCPSSPSESYHLGSGTRSALSRASISGLTTGKGACSSSSFTAQPPELVINSNSRKRPNLGSITIYTTSKPSSDIHQRIRQGYHQLYWWVHDTTMITRDETLYLYLQPTTPNFP